MFALGIHRPQTDEERRLIIGEEMHSRIRCFDHIAADDAGLVEIGTTSFGNRVEINREVWEADRIILTGEIIYHLIAGYSGGRKSLVPGVAGFRTTTFNHRMIFDPDCRAGKLDGNPAHEDLLEACRMADPDFIVNVVLSPEGKLIRVVAGHYDLAHREGCRTVDRMLRVEIEAPYDLIVASAGGFPLDIDLRQAHKGLENACQALRPGGAILFYAECPNGAGIGSFEDYVRRYRDDFEMREALSREFVVGGHKAYWVARLGPAVQCALGIRPGPGFRAALSFHAGLSRRTRSGSAESAAGGRAHRPRGGDPLFRVHLARGAGRKAGRKVIRKGGGIGMTTSTELKPNRNYIGGEWIDTPDHDVVRLPYDGTPVGEVPRAGLDLVERAVAAARQGFAAMRAMANYERADLLLRVADLLRRDLAEYTQLICAETGKPIKEAKVEASRGLETLVAAAHEARQLRGEVVPMEFSATGKGRMAMTVREPIGVIGCITPFNVPLNLALHKVAPALAARQCGDSQTRRPKRRSARCAWLAPWKRPACPKALTT